MNKQDFLVQLRKGLSGLPQDDIEERLTFYKEMIEDRMEEGFSEEEAVSAIGSVEDIVRQSIADIPLAKIAKERIRPKRHLKVWEVMLLTLGSPIWLSLSVAAAAIILSLYISLWAVMISLWALFGSLAICAVASIPGYMIYATHGSNAAGLAMLSAGIVCAGLSIFMFFGCRAATKAILMLTKKTTIWLKNRFIRKEEVQ